MQRLVVADIVRLDKGHTEGIDPNITELVKLLLSAKGGKTKSEVTRSWSQIQNQTGEPK